MKVKIAQIKVGERVRKEMGDLDGLAHSMSTIGQLSPIILTRDYELVAGERRLRAAQKLGWKEIEARFVDELSESEKRLIELEENIRRHQMSWQEEVRGIALVHRLKVAEHGARKRGLGSTMGSWSIEQTGQMFGMGISKISKILQLAEAIDIYPVLEKCPNWTTAYTLLTRMKRLALQQRIAQETQKEAKDIAGVLERHAFVCADAVEYLRGMEAESVDCFVLDPPWGVDSTKDLRSPGAIEASGIYDDGVEYFKSFLEKLIPEMVRVLKNDRHMYILAGMEHYIWLYQTLERHIRTDPIPIIWDCGNVRRLGLLPERWEPSYLAIFHSWKGHRPVKAGPSCVIRLSRIAGVKRIHPHQKPPALWRPLIAASCEPGELVCDPCAGSGSVAVAAYLEGMRSLCIDKDPGVVAAAKSYFTLEVEKHERSNA